jgi:hypothetical protein
MTANKTINLRSPKLNIFLAVQPKIAMSFLLNDNLNSLGLVSRFLPIFSNAKAYPMNSLMEPDLSDYYYNCFCEMIKKMCDITISMNLPQTITFSKDAFNLINNWAINNYNIPSYVYRDQFNSQWNINVQNLAGKFKGTVCRIAALLAIAENPSLENLVVSECHIQAAIQIGLSLFPHAEYAIDPAGYQALQDAIKIREFLIRESKSGFTERIIQQNVRISDKSNLHVALQALVQHNTIRQIPGPVKAPAYVVRPDLVPPDPRFVNLQFFNLPVSPNPTGNLPGGFHSNL